MTAPLDLEKLKRAAEAATPGDWNVWAEPVPDRYAAIFELSEQVHATDNFVGKLFLLNASGKCPATTGCGPTAEANANYIATFDPPTVLALLAQLEAAKERERVLTTWAKEALLFIDGDDVAGSELETADGVSYEIATRGYAALGAPLGDRQALSSGEKEP